MTKIPVFSKDGKRSGTMSVPRVLVTTKPSLPLLHQVVTGLLANRRRGTAHTKTRGEVRGGGRKPWRQKGTGRARAGSIRSPLWRGGGTVFGPRKERNYSVRISKSMRKIASRQIIAEKIRSGGMYIVTNLEFKKPKTRYMEEFLQKLPIKEGRVLLLTDEISEEIRRMTANLPYLTLRTSATINPIDLLLADSIIVTKKAFEILEKRYAV